MAKRSTRIEGIPAKTGSITCEVLIGMGDDRLPTALYLDAHFRRLDAEGVFYYVPHKGAHVSGTILVKINGFENGCVLLQQQRDLGGSLGWMKLFKGMTVEESEVDAYIQRAVGRDPDIWVIEIEDRQLKNPFEGKVF